MRLATMVSVKASAPSATRASAQFSEASSWIISTETSSLCNRGLVSPASPHLLQLVTILVFRALQFLLLSQESSAPALRLVVQYSVIYSMAHEISLGQLYSPHLRCSPPAHREVWPQLTDPLLSGL